MPNIGKPDRAYSVTIGDSTHFGAIQVDYKGKVTGYTLFPIGGGGGGISWGGEWVDTSYSNLTIVTHKGDLYICTSAVSMGDAEPGIYTYDAIEPDLWLSSGVEPILTFDGSEQVFYPNSTLQDVSVQSARAVNVNLTVGGTLTLDSSFLGSLPDFFVVVVDSTGFAINFYSGTDFPAVMTGMTAGVYKFLICREADTRPVGTVSIKVTASAGAVMSAAPTQKWVLMKRHTWPGVSNSGTNNGNGFGILGGIARDQQFHEQVAFGSGAISFDLRVYSTLTASLSGAATNLILTTTGISGEFYTNTATVKISIYQGNGSGSLPVTFWTGATLPEGPIQNAQDIPTSLGTTIGDSIVVWLQICNLNGLGYTPAWNCIAWSATSKASRRTVLVPTTGFSTTILDGVDYLLLNPAGTLATGTITFPATPTDNKVIHISSTKTITALTLAGNGNTIAAPVTTLGIGPLQAIRYVFDKPNATWWPT